MYLSLICTSWLHLQVFSVLRTLKDKANPEEMRACLVSYLAQELKLTRAYGLSAADIARVASESVGLLPAKLNMNEGICPNPQVTQEDVVFYQTAVSNDFEDLAKPLETDINLEQRIASDLVPIASIPCSSVSSQTDDLDTTVKNNCEEVSENHDADKIPEINMSNKKEEGCQTDALLVGSYTLDLSEEVKTCTEIIPGPVVAASTSTTAPEIPVKPKTPSRSMALRPTVTAPFTRGISRPVPRGRGLVNDVRPNSAQPRLMRTATETKIGMTARGLVRRTLEPRVRPATSNGVITSRQVSRILTLHVNLWV
jgi:hypothetical protein